MVIIVAAAALPSPHRTVEYSQVIDVTMDMRGELCVYDREEEQPVLGNAAAL